MSLSTKCILGGWTVHNLLFKRFPKGWQIIQQGDIDVPRVCVYWCREWKLHRRFLFCLRCTGVMKAADPMIRSSSKSSIGVIFVWKLLIVSHVTEHTFTFCRATGDRICRESPVACRTSRVTEHSFSVLRPKQNGRHFADDVFKCIFLNENAWISLKISLKIVPRVPINNIPALVQMMVWHRPGDKAFVWINWGIYASLGLNELNEARTSLFN